MTYMTELSRAYCPECDEFTYEARVNSTTGRSECPDCGGEVQ